MFDMLLQFSNLLGCCYRKGNLLFTADGYRLISPVGNRVSIFDLKRFMMFSILFSLNEDFRCGFKIEKCRKIHSFLVAKLIIEKIWL